MSTALSTVDTGILARYGSEQEIATFMQRAAAIFAIPPEDLERPAVQASLVKATQNCLRYGYLPGIHVHMIPFNTKVDRPHPQNPAATIKVTERVYAPDMGEKAWKDSADRIAKDQSFTYLVQTKAMTADEVKAATALIPDQDWHANDAGCKARVIRSDHMALFQAMGERYDPEYVQGFWRQKKDKWGNPDTIPNGRTPADVAMRRATKSALMAVFHLVPIDEYEDSLRFRRLSAYVETESAPAASALPGILHTRNGYEVAEDGEIWEKSWEDSRPALMAEEKAKMQAEPAPSITSLDDVEALDPNPSPASAEWAAIPGVQAGVTATEHAAQQKVTRPDWNNPTDAKTWAVEQGACASEFEASASLKKIVGAHFGGNLNSKNMDAAMDMFFLRQIEKLAAAVPA